MKIELLRYVVVTARCSSITEAAQRLFLHQTTLSSAIKNVESSTGVTIFERSKNGIVLTEEGKKLIPLAEELLEKWDQIQAISQTNSNAGNVRLLSNVIAADQYSIDLLTAFRNSYPQGNISISTVSKKDFLSKMLKYNYKVGIGFMEPAELDDVEKQMEKNGFVFKLLRTYHTYLYVSQNSQFYYRKSVSLSELSNEHLALSENGLLEHHYSEFAEQIGITSVLANIYLVRRAVINENMIAFYLAENDEPEDWFNKGTNIKKIALVGAPPCCVAQNYLIYRPVHSLSPPERALIQCIMDTLS